MFTPSELEIVTKEGAKEAINQVLENLMIYDGRINVDYMERSQIEYAIHLLREFKAMMPGASPNVIKAA